MLVAVSYTHLDVYKRQVVLCDEAEAWDRNGGVSLSTCDMSRGRQTKDFIIHWLYVVVSMMSMVKKVTL